MEQAHSILPPSSANIWGSTNGCTGWVLMAQTYPDCSDKAEAREGEASHEIAKELIDNYARGISLSWQHFEGRLASNGVAFTIDHYEAAREYADDVRGIMVSHGNFAIGQSVLLEEKIQIPRVHSVCFGTPDSAIYSPHLGAPELVINDYKYGHLIVEHFENWQLLCYYAGLLDRFEIDGNMEQNLTVRLRIYQPRAYHRDGPIREWKAKACDLRGYINILQANAEIALGPDAMLRTGPHCRYCSARTYCQPAIDAGLGLFEVAAQPMPIELTPAQLGLQLAIVKRAKKQLEALETGYQERVEHIIRNGKSVPHWELKTTYGREKWKAPAEEIAALGDMYETNVRKPVEVITPKQARDLGIPEDVVETFSEKPKTGLALAPDNTNRAKQVFTYE